MVSYLTQGDVNTYGHELVDFAQRAAAHVVAPHLQQLDQQTAELRERLAQEANLDRAVERELPNYQEIDRDPRWHRFLLEIDPYTGRPRQVLLNDAVASGSAERVVAFFRGFLREVGDIQSPTSARAVSGRARPAASSSEKSVYTRTQIAKLYEQHRRGAYSGREQEWARLEYDIYRASAEGRVLNPVDVHGK
jgi:hypothetical protein